MIQEVEPDWSRFKNTEISVSLFKAVNTYAQKMLEKLSADFVQESSEEVLVRNREDFRELNPIAQAEVANFTTSLVKEQPGISPETLNLAVQAVIRLEKSRSGIGLLEKLMKLDDQDLDGLDRILSQWTVQDAVTVLDEIDRRLSVVAAIEKLSGDEHADELHTLHPLVTHARWLFGPEFDSPEFSSNASLKTAAFKVLKIEKSESSFINSRKRPDIVINADSTFSVVGTESFDSLANNLSTVRDVLIIELKKGRSAIDREAMTQADGYVQDFLTCGLLDGSPFITAFVVGHSIADKTAEKKEVEISSIKKGRVFAVTYHQLARTANQRLLRLKEKIPSRYEEMSGYELVNKVMNIPSQAPVL